MVEAGPRVPAAARTPRRWAARRALRGAPPAAGSRGRGGRATPPRTARWPGRRPRAGWRGDRGVAETRHRDDLGELLGRPERAQQQRPLVAVVLERRSSAVLVHPVGPGRYQVRGEEPLGRRPPVPGERLDGRLELVLGRGRQDRPETAGGVRHPVRVHLRLVRRSGLRAVQVAELGERARGERQAVDGGPAVHEPDVAVGGVAPGAFDRQGRDHRRAPRVGVAAEVGAGTLGQPGVAAGVRGEADGVVADLFRQCAQRLARPGGEPDLRHENPAAPRVQAPPPHRRDHQGVLVRQHERGKLIAHAATPY